MNAYIPACYYKKCIGNFLINEINIVEPNTIIFLGVTTFRSFIRMIAVKEKSILYEPREIHNPEQAAKNWEDAVKRCR